MHPKLSIYYCTNISESEGYTEYTSYKLFKEDIINIVEKIII